MVNILDLLILIAGLLLILYSGKDKPEAIGKIMFGAGLLAFLLAAAAFSVRLF